MTSADLVAFDLETTGLSAKSDRVLEIGAVRFRPGGAVVDRFQTIVDPGMPIPLAVQRLTGITERDVEGAATPVEAMAMFADFCDGTRLVAHGAAFDIAFCASLVPEAFQRRDVLDTLELARVLLPVAASHSLPLLSSSLDIEHERPHRALPDAEATRALFAHLQEAAEELPEAVLAEIRAQVSPVAGPLRDFFLHAVTGAGRPGRPALRGPAVRRLRAVTATTPASPDSAPLDVAAAALLGPDGPLAGIDPDYELRESQVEMARAVGQTLERAGRLMVEAGTGTGKSIAYLTPLALWSRRTGRRAVVATHTITLQEQLVERDLPMVDRLLPEPVSHALLKGRSHYISLRRWDRLLTAGPDPTTDLDLLRFRLKLLVWLSQTETGDRAELRLSGAEEGLWRQVRSDTDDCLGPGCANWRDGACFMVAARRRALDADIVVTNHALLLAGAERQGQVLGPFDAVVVDEAHHLEEAATRQLGAVLRAADVLRVVDRLLPASAGHAATGAGHDHASAGEAPAERVAAALARCREGVQRLFGDIKGFVAEVTGEEHPGNRTVGVTDALREGDAHRHLDRSARHAVRVLLDAATTLDGARGTVALPAVHLPQPDRLDDELALAADTLREAADVVLHGVCEPRDGHVAWLELRAEQAEIHESPVAVADRLAGSLFDQVGASVLTSATLSVAGSFDFLRSRTGVGAGAEALALPSPFDYLSQSLLVLPSGMPHYDDPAYDEVLASLCGDVALRLDGRTLVLFTGYQPLRRAHGLLQSRLERHGVVVLGQGLDGTRRQILASFLQNPRALLLGTSSFWEGIDIPGDALRCVVIAKLPFPVPTDPLVQARSHLLEDPFGGLALPTCVLRLRQGFGRLIRHGTDRGAVVLADGRVTLRDYGPAVVASLPGAAVVRVPATSVGDAVERFVLHHVVPPQEAGLAAPPDWSDEPA